MRQSIRCARQIHLDYRVKPDNDKSAGCGVHSLESDCIKPVIPAKVGCHSGRTRQREGAEHCPAESTCSPIRLANCLWHIGIPTWVGMNQLVEVIMPKKTNTPRVRGVYE